MLWNYVSRLCLLPVFGRFNLVFGFLNHRQQNHHCTLRNRQIWKRPASDTSHPLFDDESTNCENILLRGDRRHEAGVAMLNAHELGRFGHLKSEGLLAPMTNYRVLENM